jgi:hypothetical protein
VLTGPGFGNDPALSHSQRQQRLPERVVDLVGAGVIQVFPLEHDPRADGLAEAGGLAERRRPAHELRQQLFELGPEGRILPGGVVQSRQVVERRDQGLGHVAPSVRTETAGQTLVR